MKFGIECVLKLAVMAFVLVAVVEQAHAIPAFTRAHKAECTTCHTIFPELNEYGEAFLKNSYVYFGKGKKQKGAVPVPVQKAQPKNEQPGSLEIKGDGDSDKLAKLKGGAMGAPAGQPAAAETAPKQGGAESGAAEQKPEGVALSGIPDLIPVSFVGTVNASYVEKAVNDFDFSTRSLKMHAGGNFREVAGFYGTYVAYSEQPPVGNFNTSTTASNNKTDLNEFLAVWRHPFELPLNIRIGRMQPKLGLWKSTNKLMTTNSFAPYAYRVGTKSEFRLEQAQDAIELNSLLGGRFYMSAGVANRKGQNAKEFYGHASYKFGGADYLANEPDIDLEKDTSILDFLSVTIGAYGYGGRNGNSNTQPGVAVVQNEFYRSGLDLDILYKQFRLRLAGVLGQDDNPELTATNYKLKSYVGAIEGEYIVLENLIGAMRYEYEDNGYGFKRRYIPSLVYAPIQNFKVALEYKHERITGYKTTLATVGQDLNNNVGTLGVTFGF